MNDYYSVIMDMCVEGDVNGMGSPEIANALIADSVIRQAAFETAVNFGHLQIVVDVYNLGNVDVEGHDAAPFYFACSLGFLEIAQFLHANGVDIHAGGNKAYRTTLSRGLGHILEWLRSLESAQYVWG